MYILLIFFIIIFKGIHIYLIMNTTKIDDTIIYLPKNKIENETYDLINKMNKSEVLNEIRIMPDCHSSSYCCVGMTCIIIDKVIPQIVGGDIGCGIIAYNLNYDLYCNDNYLYKLNCEIKECIDNELHYRKILDEVNELLRNLCKSCQKCYKKTYY